MIAHTELGENNFEIKRRLKLLIDTGKITLGGNRQLKIYGTLGWKSGKRMKMKNRVFFLNEEEAAKAGYRPCGHCLREKYQDWKRNIKLNPDSQTPP